MKKKVLALLSAVVMTASVAACGGSSDKDTATNAPANNATEAPANNATQAPANAATDAPAPAAETRELNPRLMGFQSEFDNYGLSREPITLTVNMGAGALRGNGGVMDSMNFEVLKDATGITLNFISTDEEKFAVLAAGGDLPDIIINTTTADIVHDLLKGGTYMNMEPLMAQYGKNLTATLPENTVNFAKFVAEDAGNPGLYFLPNGISNIEGFTSLQENGSGGAGYYTRYDIYEAIGAPSVADANGYNEDLFIDMLKKGQDYMRNDLGISNAWALLGFTGWGSAWTTFAQYREGVQGFNALEFYNVQDGGALPPWSDKNSPLWDNFKFYNKAYRAGIFDPESFIVDAATAEARVRAGEVMAMGHAWWFDWDTQPVFLIKGLDYYPNVYNYSNFIGEREVNSRAINAKCKYPERAMAMLDYLASDEWLRTRNVGLKGVEWDYNDKGQPMIIGDNLASYNGDEAAKELYGEGKKYDNWFTDALSGVSNKICADGYPAQIWITDYWRAQFARENPMQKYFFRANGAGPEITMPGQVYEQWVKAGAKTNPAPSIDYLFIPTAPQDIADKVNSIRAYIFDDMQAKLIMAGSDDEFNKTLDDMCKTIANMGMQEVYDDYLARYAASKATADGIRNAN